MKAGKASIRTKAIVIGGRLKQPIPEIEPFLYREMPGNPLTTSTVLVNHGPQVDSNASDRNAKHDKHLHARNVDGQFRFEIRNESSEIEGLGEIHYGDEGAIMEDDEQELDEGDLDNDNDHEEAFNDLDI